jgi:thiol-disulfide isomerase/thioredoxin
MRICSVGGVALPAAPARPALPHFSEIIMADPFSIRRYPACVALALLVALAMLTPRVWSAPAAAPDEGAEAATKEPAVTLHPGDPAPKLYVSKWVKGEPVKEFEKGKVYVIECWASWCGPCRASIPHVTELQAKYKDKGLTVIGMNVWEHDLSAAEPFVKEMGDKMGYTVALDETDPKHPDPTGAGKTAKAWLAAAGQNGIPCSFIVDKDTKVAWIGHPMAMDRPLEQVVAGTFDAKKEAELQAKSEGLQKKISDAVRAKDYDKAMGALDELAAADASMAKQVGMMKLSLLMRKQDYAGANKQAAQLADGQLKDDPQMQGQVALLLLNSPDASKVDADLTMKLAEKAYAASPDDLTTQKATALAYAAKKNFAKAAELQEKVVGQLKGPMKDRESKLLDEYKTAAAGGGK